MTIILESLVPFGKYNLCIYKKYSEAQGLTFWEAYDEKHGTILEFKDSTLNKYVKDDFDNFEKAERFEKFALEEQEYRERDSNRFHVSYF